MSPSASMSTIARASPRGLSPSMSKASLDQALHPSASQLELLASPPQRAKVLLQSNASSYEALYPTPRHNMPGTLISKPVQVYLRVCIICALIFAATYPRLLLLRLFKSCRAVSCCAMHCTTIAINCSSVVHECILQSTAAANFQ